MMTYQNSRKLDINTDRVPDCHKSPQKPSCITHAGPCQCDSCMPHLPKEWFAPQVPKLHWEVIDRYEETTPPAMVLLHHGLDYCNN